MSCGVPPVVSTVTASLKVTVAVTASPVLKAPSAPALLNAMESTLGPALISWVMVSVTVSPMFQVSPGFVHRRLYPLIRPLYVGEGEGCAVHA